MKIRNNMLHIAGKIRIPNRTGFKIYEYVKPVVPPKIKLKLYRYKIKSVQQTWFFNSAAIFVKVLV